MAVGADPELKDRFGNTPLRDAARRHPESGEVHAEVIEFFIGLARKEGAGEAPKPLSHGMSSSKNNLTAQNTLLKSTPNLEFLF